MSLLKAMPDESKPDPRWNCPWKCPIGDKKCLCQNQQPLGKEFEKVLMDNLTDLYVR